MSTSGGRHRAERLRQSRRTPTFVAVVGYLCGAVVGATTWWLLIRLAIRYGDEARSGDSGSWTHLLVASAAAVGCLLGSLVAARRLLVEVGALRERRPRRARRR